MFELDLAKFLSASKDVITIEIDARGTTGRGAAYQNAIFSHVGQVDVDDVIHAARYESRRGNISVFCFCRIKMNTFLLERK